MEYINKDVYGNFALSGSIFLSSANQPDFTDPYNLIYGHHMSNGAMFGDVVEFTDEAYLRHMRPAHCICRRKPGRLQSLPAWRRKPQTDESMAISQNRTQPGRCGTFVLCEGTCCAVSGYPGDRGRFRCCPVHLCGVCHKRRVVLFRKIGEGF